VYRIDRSFLGSTCDCDDRSHILLGGQLLKPLLKVVYAEAEVLIDRNQFEPLAAVAEDVAGLCEAVVGRFGRKHHPPSKLSFGLAGRVQGLDDRRVPLTGGVVRT
jgi:hypothetical protein